MLLMRRNKQQKAPPKKAPQPQQRKAPPPPRIQPVPAGPNRPPAQRIPAESPSNSNEHPGREQYQSTTDSTQSFVPIISNQNPGSDRKLHATSPSANELPNAAGNPTQNETESNPDITLKSPEKIHQRHSDHSPGREDNYFSRPEDRLASTEKRNEDKHSGSLESKESDSDPSKPSREIEHHGVSSDPPSQSKSFNLPGMPDEGGKSHQAPQRASNNPEGGNSGNKSRRGHMSPRKTKSNPKRPVGRSKSEPTATADDERKSRKPNNRNSKEINNDKRPNKQLGRSVSQDSNIRNLRRQQNQGSKGSSGPKNYAEPKGRNESSKRQSHHSKSGKPPIGSTRIKDLRAGQLVPKNDNQKKQRKP